MPAKSKNSQRSKLPKTGVQASSRPSRSRKSRSGGNAQRQSNGVGKTTTSVRQAPISRRTALSGLGMSDLMGHRVSYLTGYVYVGNNTLGDNDSVYFLTADAATTVTGNIPIAPADSIVGAPYVNDVEKHYARKRYRQVKLRLVPAYPSTAISMEAMIAPRRGGGSLNASGLQSGTENAFAAQSVLSMAGNKTAASWEEMEIDMTDFIAGGSGAKQNEFDIDNAFNTNTSIMTTADTSGLGVVPCSFAVSGSYLDGTPSLRGKISHYVIIDVIEDLLDFVGLNTVIDPVGKGSAAQRQSGLEMPRLKPCERFGAKYPINCDSKEEYNRRQVSLVDDRKVADVSSLGRSAADTASLIGDELDRRLITGPPKGPIEKATNELISDYVKLRSLSKDRKVDVPKGPPDKPIDKSTSK